MKIESAPIPNRSKWSCQAAFRDIRDALLSAGSLRTDKLQLTGKDLAIAFAVTMFTAVATASLLASGEAVDRSGDATQIDHRKTKSPSQAPWESLVLMHTYLKDLHKSVAELAEADGEQR